MTPRAAIIPLIALAVMLLVALMGIGFGSTWIAPERVLAVLLGAGERTENIIVMNLRAPRVVMAGLAGAAVAGAGYLLQTVTRNSLASPGVLGVMDGAALGVVSFLALLEGPLRGTSIHWQPVAALIGAVIAMAAVFLTAGRQAQSPIRLLLFGIAVGAVAKAGVIIATIISPIYRASQFSRWSVGAVNEATWAEIDIVLPVLAVALVLVLLSSRALRPVVLDEVSVRGLGVNLPLFRLWIFGLAALLTAAVVAFVGAVGFVGLIAPHMARLLVGRAVIPALATSLFLGATLLILADLAVRVLFAPVEVPAGTVMAVLGTPYFLFLLLRKGKLDG